METKTAGCVGDLASRMMPEWVICTTTRQRTTAMRTGGGGAGEEGSRWVVVGVLVLLCLMMRMLGLGKGIGSLPIFGDEAIYLRWAQLIRAGHWWVSLVDPKPPLHFWLMAAVFDWTRDPLLAARLISVGCGLASVPALILVCDEVALLTRGVAASGRILGLLTTILMIFCPFVAFYQRLATADALFMLEMLFAVWLALRWGRLAANGGARWGTTIGLGVAMGAGMMTRQGLSYLLWAMPVVAFFLHGASRNRRALAKALLQLGLAGAIAATLWTPYLVADFDHFASDRGGTLNELKTRIFYQGQFTNSRENRTSVILRNAHSVFIPSWNDGQPETGWLYLYMTPPLYVACLAGLLWLGVRRQWKILALLLVWIALMLGAPMVLGTVLRSRYIVAGVMPLLVAAAFFVAEMLGLALSLRRAIVGWPLTIALFAGLLVLPLQQIARQGTTWWTQTLTREDRYQHITGWTAGLATMAAIDFVRNFVPRAPGGVVLLTNDGWGTPADAEWVYLSNVPNLTLYYTNPRPDHPLLMAAPDSTPDTYRVKMDKWLYTPEVPVHIDREHTVVLYMNNDPVYTADGPVDAETYFRKLNPNLAKVRTFYNVGAGADRVVLFELTSVKRKNNG